MASLVAPLASDNTGAASGSAEFYSLGTSDTASVYSDSDAQTAETTHTLSATGSIVRYVTEPVTVVLKDSSGAEVKRFDWLDDAKLVRVNNAIATGDNPAAEGQTISAGNTTLHALLTLLQASMGADDGYVSVNGVEHLLKNILATGTGVFLDVVNDYGADDSGEAGSDQAFQDAFDDIEAAGGGIVHVPYGSYITTGALNVPKGCILLGDGASTTTITQQTSGVNGWLTITDDDVTIIGIRFARDTTSMTGRIISSTKRAHVIGCRFDGFNGPAVYLAAAASDVRCWSCTFTVTESSGRVGSGASAAATLKLTNCTVTHSVAGTAFDTSTFVLTGCEYAITVAGSTVFASGTVAEVTGGFIASTTTSGTVTITAGTLAISGVRITTGSSGTLQLGSSATHISESGCIFGSADVGVGSMSAGHSTTRDHRAIATNVAGTSYTPDINYAIHEVTQTSGATFAFANPAVSAPVGWMMLILYYNTSGTDNITPSWGTAFNVASINSAVGAVDNNMARHYLFYKFGTATTDWVGIAGSLPGTDGYAL